MEQARAESERRAAAAGADAGEGGERTLLAGLRAFGRGLQRLPRGAGLALAAGWMGGIWLLSSVEGEPTRFVFWRAWLHNCAHAPLYGLLALWWCVALPRAGGWPRLRAVPFAAVFLATVLYGAVDEWHQGSTPGRDSSLRDVVTDLVGAAATLWIVAYVGSARAGRRGLLLRLALGVLACAAAALLATLR